MNDGVRGHVVEVVEGMGHVSYDGEEVFQRETCWVEEGGENIVKKLNQTEFCSIGDYVHTPVKEVPQ